MKTARRANLEGALIGKLVTIVRGERYFTIPSRELRDLADLIRDLDDDTITTPASAPARASTPPVSIATATAPPRPAPVPPAAPTRSPVSAATTPSTPAPAEPKAPRQKPGAAAAAPPPTTQRRGRVWEGIQALIRAGGPQSYVQIRAMVERDKLTDRDVDHAVKIAIGKKRSAGDLIELPSGLYTVPGADAPSSKVVEETAGATADKRRHRPGALWQSMRAYLAKFPEGLTDKEIVAATAKHGWTTAADPSHAVKICLTRVREQLERTSNGRYRLAGMPAVEVAEPAAEPSSVRVRKRRADAEAAVEATSTATVVETAPAPSAEASEPTSGPDFDAARHYPNKRRARAS